MDKNSLDWSFLVNLNKPKVNRDLGFPDGSVVKNPPANTGDTGLIPGSVRSPGQGNGNLLEYSCLRNTMDGEIWKATVHGGHKIVGHNLVTKQQQHCPC